MAHSRTTPAASPITLRRRGALALAATVVAATTLGVTATAYAKNGGENKKDVRSTVACGTGSFKLKAKYDDGGRIEVEAEMDRNVTGEKWALSLSDNGKTVWSGERTTAGASGSFSVETTLAADGTPTDVPSSSPSTPPSATPTGTPTATPTGTPDDNPSGDDTASTTTTAPGTGGDSSSTSPSDDSSSTTTAPTTGEDNPGRSGDDSSSTTTAPTTGEDNPGRSGGHHSGFRVSSKGGDDKPGDDKGGKSNPGNGKHEIAVNATLGALTCGTKVNL
jgi:hypothetical protein